MPLMVEPLVMRFVGGQKYGVNGSLKEILPLVRQAVELGADVIKADPTDDLSEYHKGTNSLFLSLDLFLSLSYLLSMCDTEGRGVWRRMKGISAVRSQST
jgi:hypothetical protein